MLLQRKILLLLFIGLVSAQNWKNIKFARVNDLERRQQAGNVPVDPAKLQDYGVQSRDEAHFQHILRNILKVRVPGTQGNKDVRDFIENEMASLGWGIEEDSFEQNTVIGPVRFTNIIATLDPGAPRRMVIACHYDSKLTPRGFLGATDSAVPCAQMINLAYSLRSSLETSKGRDLTLQFIFFDGEEAFRRWSSTDSLYGSRHLASKWAQTPFEYNGISGNQLDRIEVFMLLDLLGASNPTITSSHSKTEPWFKRLIAIENNVVNRGLTSTRSSNRRIFRTRSSLAGLLGQSSIEDDHKPFERRGVPILHIISSPFPRVWHTANDNANAIDLPTVEKLNTIFRVFVSEYLSLP